MSRKIDIFAFVWFDENFYYYDINFWLIRKKNNYSIEIDDFWSEANNDEFGKPIAGKQIVKRNIAKNSTTL